MNRLLGTAFDPDEQAALLRRVGIGVEPAPGGAAIPVAAGEKPLSAVSGEPALVMGKPSLVAYELPTADMGLRPEQVAMVSDDPDVDLATIAFFNDALDVRAENERRYKKATEDK